MQLKKSEISTDSPLIVSIRASNETKLKQGNNKINRQYVVYRNEAHEK